MHRLDFSNERSNVRLSCCKPRRCSLAAKLVLTLFVGVLVLLSLASATTAATEKTPVGEIVPSYLQKKLDASDAAHLLARTGIGSSPRDLLQYIGLTRSEAIEKLLSGIRTSPHTPVPDWVNNAAPHYSFRGSMQINQQRDFNRQRDAELAQLRQWWISEMLQTPSPQTERLVLFWHNHFVSAYSAINRQSTSMARQNQLFRQYAKGNFRTFVKAVLRDPAMLDYLDNRSNRKQSPNENLARELLELFTMGEGNYSEADVKNAARALTGFTVAPKHDMHFQFVVHNHDFSEKVLFGHSGNFGTDELVDLIMEQPAVATFITKKFWHEYVNSTSINEAAVDSVATQFRDSDYSLEVLFRRLLQLEEFWSQQNRLAIIKSPVDLVVGTLRSRGLGGDHAAAAVSVLAQQGQNLFEPPNVAGWSGGESWITPNRLFSRMTWLNEFSAGLENSDSVLADASAMDGSSAAGSVSVSAFSGDNMQTSSTDNAMNPVVEDGESMMPGSMMAGPMVGESMPGESMPGELLPGESMPGESMPGKSMSDNTMQSNPMYESDMSGALPAARSEAAGTAATRVIAKLASDDFRGTPEVNIQLLRTGKVVWQSANLHLKPGRDTLRHGVSTDHSDFVFQKYKFITNSSNPKPALPDYDEVRFHFVNDLSDGDGDRNVYVEWVNIDGKVYHASDGRQQSKCIPANPFNAGYLYCGGYLSILTAGSATGPASQHAENSLQFDSNGLHAGQVFLDRAHHPHSGKQKNPGVAFSLADVALGNRRWNNLQVQLVKLHTGQYQMVFQRYNCWPDCFHQWPVCSNRSEHEPYFRAVRILLEANALDPDIQRRGGNCRLSDLHVKDANLVMALWRSLPELAVAAQDDRKLTRKNLRKHFDLWHSHLDKARALAPPLPDDQGSTPRLTTLLPADTALPESKIPENAIASMTDSSANQNQRTDGELPTAWIESVETLFAGNKVDGYLRTLFTPLGSQAQTGGSDRQSSEQFSELLSSPVFQLK